MNRKVLDLVIVALMTASPAGAQHSAHPIARRVPTSTVMAAVGTAELPGEPAGASVSSTDEPSLADDPQAQGAAAPGPGPAPHAATRAERGEERKARILAKAAAKGQEGSRREERVYQQGSRALDEHEWDRAIDEFDEVIQLGGSRVDGATYWKAYAQNKQGDRAAALATLGELEEWFPKSLWLNDAKALEVEVRQASGHPVSPENESDEELQLMALNVLMNSDPERALPLLEKILTGNKSPKLKERALFVLTQSRLPQAKTIVARIAKGGSNPDLQVKAINDLGMFGGKDSRDLLAEIYASSSDRNAKRAVLRSFMMSGDRAHVLAAAQGEKDESLREDAIHQLGIMGGQPELWQLYQQESSVKIKETILHSMFTGGNADKLLEVARSEKDPTLRRAAIHSLGMMGQKSGAALASIYPSEQDKDVRKEVIGALFIQGNAQALVEIARKETDPELKKQAVSKLAVMHSKEGTDYLMELLNK